MTPAERAIATIRQEVFKATQDLQKQINELRRRVKDLESLPDAIGRKMELKDPMYNQE